MHNLGYMLSVVSKETRKMENKPETSLEFLHPNARGLYFATIPAFFFTENL